MTNITKAYIELNNHGKLDSEMSAVKDELSVRNIPVELFSHKQLQRHKLELDSESIVVGYVDSMVQALKQLNVEIPSSNDYPNSLHHMLYRRIEEGTLRDLRNRIYAGQTPIFAKPRLHKKKFTGRVFESIDDYMYLSSISIHTPIYLTDVVVWQSEYRVYVLDSNIVALKHYAGDSTITVDEKIAESAVNLLTQSGESTAGYAIDFGVLSGGETALIEWNDGFSLGSYDLDRSIYTDLLIARWSELMEQIS